MADDIKNDFDFSCLEKNGGIITFIKKSSGEERVMRCTRNKDMIPDNIIDALGKGRERFVPSNIMVVYDLDKKDWRSFDVDTVTNVEAL